MPKCRQHALLPCASLQVTHWLLHGEEGQDLQQVVLDDVAHNAILIKVAAPPLRPKVLAEDDLSSA